MNHVKIVTILLLLAMLYACSSPTRKAAPTGPATVATPAPDKAFSPPAPDGVPVGEAVSGLLKQSQQQRAAGDFSAAAESLERALRIEPTNAWLWNRLAQLRLLQGRYAQAAALAGKSNALAGDSMRLREENQAIIAAVGEIGRP